MRKDLTTEILEISQQKKYDEICQKLEKRPNAYTIQPDAIKKLISELKEPFGFTTKYNIAIILSKTAYPFVRENWRQLMRFKNAVKLLFLYEIARHDDITEEHLNYIFGHDNLYLKWEIFIALWRFTDASKWRAFFMNLEYDSNRVNRILSRFYAAMNNPYHLQPLRHEILETTEIEYAEIVEVVETIVPKLGKFPAVEVVDLIYDLYHFYIDTLCGANKNYFIKALYFAMRKFPEAVLKRIFELGQFVTQGFIISFNKKEEQIFLNMYENNLPSAIKDTIRS